MTLDDFTESEQADIAFVGITDVEAYAIADMKIRCAANWHLQRQAVEDAALLATIRAAEPGATVGEVIAASEAIIVRTPVVESPIIG